MRCDVSRPLALWNLGLSIFSFLGMLQTAPLLIHTVGNKGVFYTVRGVACIPRRRSNPLRTANGRGHAR